MLVTIVNHNYNDQAIKLAKGFQPYAEVLTLDSGSELAPHHQDFFDIQLPNVYYSGLINAAYEALQKRSLILTSPFGLGVGEGSLLDLKWAMSV